MEKDISNLYARYGDIDAEHADSAYKDNIEYSIHENDEIIAFSISGELGVEVAEYIVKYIGAVLGINSYRYHVLLNLSDLNYLSSSGIKIFVNVHKIQKEHGKLFRIFGLNDNVKRVFEVSKLHDIFKVYSAGSDALAQLRNEIGLLED